MMRPALTEPQLPLKLAVEGFGFVFVVFSIDANALERDLAHHDVQMGMLFVLMLNDDVWTVARRRSEIAEIRELRSRSLHHLCERHLVFTSEGDHQMGDRLHQLRLLKANLHHLACQGVYVLSEDVSRNQPGP